MAVTMTELWRKVTLQNGVTLIIVSWNGTGDGSGGNVFKTSELYPLKTDGTKDIVLTNVLCQQDNANTQGFRISINQSDWERTAADPLTSAISVFNLRPVVSWSPVTDQGHFVAIFPPIEQCYSYLGRPRNNPSNITVAFTNTTGKHYAVEATFVEIPNSTSPAPTAQAPSTSPPSMLVPH